jgi:hypothetical protein
MRQAGKKKTATRAPEPKAAIILDAMVNLLFMFGTILKAFKSLRVKGLRVMRNSIIL